MGQRNECCDTWRFLAQQRRSEVFRIAAARMLDAIHEGPIGVHSLTTANGNLVKPVVNVIWSWELALQWRGSRPSTNTAISLNELLDGLSPRPYSELRVKMVSATGTKAHAAESLALKLLRNQVGHGVLSRVSCSSMTKSWNNNVAKTGEDSYSGEEAENTADIKSSPAVSEAAISV